MAGVDYKKEFRDLYQPSAKAVSLVQVPALTFAAIDGLGDPDSQIFTQAVEALYAVSFGIKMLPKQGSVPKGYFEYVVPPLEGLWRVSQGTQFDFARRENWEWTLLIRQPDFVTADLVAGAAARALAKKGNPLLSKIRFLEYCEGPSVQIMHMGPYADEPGTVAKLVQFMDQNGYAISGRHHEIYLGDPRKTQPEKLKTVLRYPVKKL